MSQPCDSIGTGYVFCTVHPIDPSFTLGTQYKAVPVPTGQLPSPAAVATLLFDIIPPHGTQQRVVWELDPVT